MEPLFHRSKESSVLWDQERQQFRVTVTMQDRFHDLGVEVIFQYPSLVITSVTPRMTRTPYTICPKALARVSACVGLEVKAGLDFLLSRTIGGGEGCRHITQLLLEACHASVQGLLTVQRMQDQGDLAIPAPAHEKIALLEQCGLAVRNSCIAYRIDRPDVSPS